MNPSITSLPFDLRPSLNGKVALVTGGMGGIGRAICQVLATHGAHVALTYADGVESEQDALAFAANLPAPASAHALDLRSIESITRCQDEVLTRWGRIDILVNNAAVGSATVATYSAKTFAQDTNMLLINADGALKMCQVFLEQMKDRAGDGVLKIINFSSVGGGLQVFPGFRISDGMSKAAVSHLTRQLAAELAFSPVDVFAICPGATNTPMFQASTLNPLTPEQRAEFIASLPKHRLIEPAEIANLVAFLASAYSTPMHGAVIDASMGLGVRPGIMSERGH